MTKTVLVTGGNGYIAGWCVAELLRRGFALHVASPLGLDDPRGPEALLRPACDGALRVLRAASRAGVGRVVLTSAAATARPPRPTEGRVADETSGRTPTIPN